MADIFEKADWPKHAYVDEAAVGQQRADYDELCVNIALKRLPELYRTGVKATDVAYRPSDTDLIAVLDAIDTDLEGLT